MSDLSTALSVVLASDVDEALAERVLNALAGQDGESDPKGKASLATDRFRSFVSMKVETWERELASRATPAVEVLTFE